jgi:putative transposase
MLVDDGIDNPEASKEGDVIGIDLGLTDFAVTSNGSGQTHQNQEHMTCNK